VRASFLIRWKRTSLRVESRKPRYRSALRSVLRRICHCRDRVEGSGLCHEVNEKEKEKKWESRENTHTHTHTCMHMLRECASSVSSPGWPKRNRGSRDDGVACGDDGKRNERKNCYCWFIIKRINSALLYNLFIKFCLSGSGQLSRGKIL